jgi:hypothetical protein
MTGSTGREQDEPSFAVPTLIDMIPPDGTGIVYMEETQGQWVFVQYERMRGWVNRLFVEPIVSRGGRFQ